MASTGGFAITLHPRLLTGNRSAALDFAGADVLTLWVERTSGGAGELDPAGEDDLVELEVERVLANATFVLYLF